MFDKKYVLLLTALCMTVCFTACTNPNAEVSKDVFAMDTFMNIRAYGEHAEDAVDRCEEEIKELDTLFDAEKTGSEINTLNNEGEIVSSQDTYNIVNRAIQASEMTGGSFDITVYPIVKLWGFITDEYRVPEIDRKSTRLNSSHYQPTRMPSSA